LGQHYFWSSTAAARLPDELVRRRMIEMAMGGSLARSSFARHIVAAAIAIAALGATPGISNGEPRDGANPDRTVTVAPAKIVCFTETLQVAGVLVPKNEVLVRPEREGLLISQVLVEPGDTVVLGQVLARLSPPEGQPGGTVAVQAPAAGAIAAVHARLGATASARAEPLFVIVGQGEMELLAETPVKNLASLAPDQSATVAILGLGQLPGKVRLASASVDPATQLGQVRLAIGNDPRLRVGTFGRASIEIDERCGAGVPLSAVLYGPGGALVHVVRDGRIETRTVTIGLIEDGQAEIRDGVSEGEMVVARAGAFVREGDRVRTVTADEAPDRP
jgi:multidrug efflux pump subunit AcrA (membrane-fusion protein)